MELNEITTNEVIESTKELKENDEIKSIVPADKEKDFELKGNRFYFKKGNTASKGISKRKVFSLREDLIKSLKRIKKSDPAKYKSIIDSYWSDSKMRPFLMEIIDGKANQRVEMSGTMSNPIRIIEVRPIIQQSVSSDLSTNQA